MKRWVISLICAVVVLVPLARELDTHPSGSSGLAFAAEQRCTDLGANCICSEPLNTSNIVRGAVLNSDEGIYAWNPADSTTKECNAEGSPGAAYSSTQTYFPYSTNDSTILNALSTQPGRPSWVTRKADGHADIFWIGGVIGGTFVKKAAIRLYVYWSSNFTFAYTGSCNNHKNFETESLTTTLEGTVDNGSGGGAHSVYGLAQSPPQWNKVSDCCFSGPNTSNYFGVTPASARRGKWYRTELVLTNRAGGASPNGFRAQIYDKNITDNGPEELVIDTRGTFASGLDPWLGWTDLTPNFRQDWLTFAGYRDGVCPGYYALSHILIAGWNTDTGSERIGAASEVEGGSPPVGTPVLTVSSIILFLFVGLGSLGSVLLGYHLWMRWRETYGTPNGGLGDLGSREVLGPVLPPVRSTIETPNREGWGAVEEGAGAADEVKGLVRLAARIGNK
jgi:hypothetical protein